MKHFIFATGCFLLLFSSASITTAQDQQEDIPANKIIKDPQDQDKFKSKVEVNGSWEVTYAPAVDVIRSLDEHTPIVGREHLPDKPRFRLDYVEESAPSDEELFQQLGKHLGLRIVREQRKATVILVRNFDMAYPDRWQKRTLDEDDVKVHVLREIDEQDNVYVVKNKSTSDFLDKLSNLSNQPILNQTSITGTFNFLFRFGEDDTAIDVLERMGFQARKAKRERLVIHVSPKEEKKTEEDK